MDCGRMGCLKNIINNMCSEGIHLTVSSENKTVT